MGDDKKSKGRRDSSRVAASQPYEVRYVADRMSVPYSEVKKAIETVGHSREAVEEYLRLRSNRYND